MLTGLHRPLPELQPVGASAALHLLAWLPPDWDEARIVEEARRLGVAIDGLDQYRITRHPGKGGPIFGHGNLTERAIEEGNRLLARAVHVGSGGNSANSVNWRPAGAARRAFSEFHGVRVGSAMMSAPAAAATCVAAAESSTSKATRMWPATRRPTSTH